MHPMHPILPIIHSIRHNRENRIKTVIDAITVNHQRPLTQINLTTTAITTTTTTIAAVAAAAASSPVSVSSPYTLPPSLTKAIIVLLYLILTNTLYLARRSHIRGPNTTVRRLLRIRTARETGVSLPLYLTTLLAWQAFVLLLFPVTEPLARLFFDRVTSFVLLLFPVTEPLA